MNKHGARYLTTISKLRNKYNEVKNEQNLPNLPKYTFSDSAVQERFMRMGREVRAFGINPEVTKDMETIAIATLHHDFIKRHAPKLVAKQKTY